MELFRNIKVYTSYKLPNDVRDAIQEMKQDAHNGSLVTIDLRDFEGCEESEDAWGWNATIIKKFFTQQGENEEVHVHIRW